MREARVLRGEGSLYNLGTREPDMSGPQARHVRSAGYVHARGRTCLVQTDLPDSKKIVNL
jgi:hypothetical protein